MIIIPIIELSDGKCCSTIRGECGTEEVYAKLSEDALNFCRFLREEDAKSLFVIDKDSFDRKDNSKNIEYIKLIHQDEKIGLNIFCYSNFGSLQECKDLLDFGILRIVVNTDHLNQFAVDELVKSYSASRVCLRIEEERALLDFEYLLSLCQKAKETGFNRIIYGNNVNEISFEDYTDNIRKLSGEIKINIVVVYPVTRFEQLLKLKEMKREGVDSIMLSNSLYGVTFPCQKIWRLVESELLC